MKLSEISNLVWNNKRTYLFGSSKDWPEDVFQHQWFQNNYPNEWVTGNDRPGWYWFSLYFDLNSLKNLTAPDGLPNQACNIPALSISNEALFSTELTYIKSLIPVIYNGHESNVLSRIRSHYSLNNDQTGALGINSYRELSLEKWSVSVFFKQHLDDMQHIDAATKDIVKKYCESKTGRTAIEQTWRSIYGWPILCKA